MVVMLVCSGRVTDRCAQTLRCWRDAACYGAFENNLLGRIANNRDSKLCEGAGAEDSWIWIWIVTILVAVAGASET